MMGGFGGCYNLEIDFMPSSLGGHMTPHIYYADVGQLHEVQTD